MTYQAKQSRFAGEWVVEAIGEDGEVYVAAFSGPGAHARAVEYEIWKNEKDSRSQITRVQQ